VCWARRSPRQSSAGGHFALRTGGRASEILRRAGAAAGTSIDLTQSVSAALGVPTVWSLTAHSPVGRSPSMAMISALKGGLYWKLSLSDGLAPSLRAHNCCGSAPWGSRSLLDVRRRERDFDGVAVTRPKRPAAGRSACRNLLPLT